MEIRFCVDCRQADDHPRHLALDGDHHMDCHAAAGCDLCKVSVQGSGGVTGAAFREHIQANGDAHRAAHAAIQGLAFEGQES